MGAMNFRNGYQFDPDDYDGQNAGGLLGLLQTAMQQRQEQLGAEYGSAPDRAGGSGGSQGGLIGRLAALQAEQAPYRQPDPTHRLKISRQRDEFRLTQRRIRQRRRTLFHLTNE